MNIEDHREYCLSLGADVEEKLPFQKFFAKQSGKAERKSGEGVLVFYVMGHMFSFFDCNDFSVISLKCQPERIEDLKAQHDCIGNPYNESSKHWIGINPNSAPDDLLQELTHQIATIPFVAHNARFDEGCLKAVFKVYQMDYPDYRFYDTLAAARRQFGHSCVPSVASDQRSSALPNHQLHTVAAACGYDLQNHHHALADAEACAAIVLYIL